MVLQMARTCDIERCPNKGTYPLESRQDYLICAKHAEQWRSTSLRLHTNPKTRKLRLVEVTVSDGY